MQIMMMMMTTIACNCIETRQFTGVAYRFEGGMEVSELERTLVETEAQLKTLWNEIGLSQTEQEESLRDLQQAVCRAATQVLSLEHDRQRKLEEEADTLHRRIGNALGELGMHETSGEDFSALSLLQRISALTKRLSELEQIKKERTETLKEKVDYIRELCFLLGDPIPVGFSETGRDLTETRISVAQGHIDALEQLVRDRENYVKELCEEVHDSVQNLRFTEQEIQEHPIDSRAMDLILCLNSSERECESNIAQGSEIVQELLHISSIKALELRKQQLQVETDSRREQLKNLALEISVLWNKLQVPEEDQKDFIDQHPGLGLDLIQAVSFISYLQALTVFSAITSLITFVNRISLV
jgi:protein regulator of cytokinesis 1